MTGKRNIAARAGRWRCAPQTAIFGWLAFVIAAFAIGGAVGTKHIDSYDGGNGESGRADKVLGQKFQQPAGERVLVQARDGRATDSQIRSAARDLSARLTANPDVTGLRKPVRSRDGHSLLVEFHVKGSRDQASDRVASTLATTSAAQRAHPGVGIEQAGDASAEPAFEKSMADDFSRASTLSLPMTLAILVVAFGALVAAGIPVLLAITGVMSTLGVVAGVSHISPVSDAIGEVILLVGMAVGVDYALFCLRREREERARGTSPEAALQAAAATSGRSVLISGLTVIVAMAGMYLTGDSTFASFATGTILVVAVAMIGSLTVLPALLSALGDRVMNGRVPLLATRRDSGRELHLGRCGGPRPATSAAGGRAGGVARGPVDSGVRAHTAAPGADALPQHLAIVKTVERTQKAFPEARCRRRSSSRPARHLP